MMKNLFNKLLIVLLALHGCTILPNNEATNVNDIIVNATIAEENNRYEEAINLYLNILDFDSNAYWAERATSIALEQNMNMLALQASEQWLLLDRENHFTKLARMKSLLRVDQLNEFEQIANDLIDQSLVPGETILRIAQEIRGEENLVHTINLFHSLNQRFPDVPESNYVLATLFFLLENYQQSLNYAERAYDLQQAWTEAGLLVARSLIRLGDDERGYQIALESLEQTQNIELFLSFGEVLLNNQIFDKAIQYYQGLEDEFGYDSRIQYGLALSMYYLENFQDSKAIFLTLIQLPNFGDEANFFLGNISIREENFLEAFRYFSRVGRGPFFIEAQETASRINAIELSSFRDSLDYIDSLVGAYPEYQEQFLLLKIRLSYDFNELQEAQKIAASGIRIQQEINFSALYAQISIEIIRELINQGLLEEALLQSSNSLVLAEDNTQLLLIKSSIEEELNQLDAAEQTLLMAYDIEPESPLINNAIGYLYTNKLARHLEALTYLEKAINLDPENAAIQDSIGWVLFNLERYQEAALYLESAYLSFPDPEVIFHLIKLYDATNENTKRDILIDQLISEHPNSIFIEQL
jgi:tetratricopeptide (TPR) repeat protein